MSSAHEELFRRLHEVAQISALVGASEHLHLECKTWSTNENDALRGIAKAICGFANSDGGVLVIGLGTTTARDKYTPDLIDGVVPVADAIVVRSRIESVVPELIEPAFAGVTVLAVNSSPGSACGFVVIDVPATEGPPCRSRKDSRFYQRINSGTYPMEYFQIEAMFGKRRRPVLSLYLEEGALLRSGHATTFRREIIFGIENTGRASAKFPCVGFKSQAGVNTNLNGIEPDGRFGLPRLPTESGQYTFGGGVDHVIYPGGVVKVARLEQECRPPQYKGDHGEFKTYFESFTLTAEISADEIVSTVHTKTIAAKSLR